MSTTIKTVRLETLVEDLLWSMPAEKAQALLAGLDRRRFYGALFLRMQEVLTATYPAMRWWFGEHVEIIAQVEEPTRLNGYRMLEAHETQIIWDEVVSRAGREELAALIETHQVEHAPERKNPASIIPEGMDEKLASWALAALADGWYEVALGGPWGLQIPGSLKDPKTGQLYHSGRRHEGDRSLHLMKDDMVVYLVDRDLLRARGQRREVRASGWFQDGQRAFEVPGVYDPEVIEDLRHRCMQCRRSVGADNLVHVAFAEEYCHDCAPAQKARKEVPGWAH